MKHLTIVFVMASLICAAPASSQTQWAKYAGNPVLDVGPAGSWDASVVAAPRVIRVLDTLKMWYTGEMSFTNSQVGYAWSVDGGITWTKYVNNPVLSPAQAWESPYLFLADVVYSNSSYKMWYTTGVGSRHKIGYAVSSDGTLWRRALNPVLSPGPSDWESQNVGWPTVLGPDTAGTYRMWYSGHASTPRPQYLGYATATNETTWAKHNQNPVFTLGVSGTWDDGAVEAPEILYDGKTYHMWYSGYRTDLLANSQIGYAISPDGVTWTRDASNPVLTPSPAGSWDDVSVLGGDIIFDGSIYHMWYTANDGAKLRVGYAISPKGMSVSVLPSRDSLDRTKDTIWVKVRVVPSTALAFSVEIESPDESPVDTIALFDDGSHGDSLAADGVFANSWIPSDQRSYYLDLQLKLHDTLHFEELDNIQVYRAAVAINLSSKIMSFGSVKLGQFKDTTIIISNTGVDTLKITNIASADTIFSARPRILTLPPGASAIDTLRFKPAAIASFSGKLVITSNAPGSPDTIAVSGTGIPTTGIYELFSKIPKEYSLSQNFPNPFNPSTEIQFSLPRRSHVTLTIFDLLGREVATLVSEELSAGSFSTRWDAAGMPSGVYFYRLQASEFAETKKLLLLR